MLTPIIGEFFQCSARTLEDISVHHEFDTNVIDDRRRKALDCIAVRFVVIGANCRVGKVVDQPPRRMVLVGEERRIGQCNLEDRHLQSVEDETNTGWNRRVAEDVIE